MKRPGTISSWSVGPACPRVASGGPTGIATRGSIRLVLDGLTLVPALDAHAAHRGPFKVDDLLAYRTSREPPCQTEARDRRTIMRRARSPKHRPLLLADLERRYRERTES